MRYRAEIDGLRAIAVIPVILFHAGIDQFGGGFVGVDVFFVISGYLITTLILTEMEQGTFSLVNFYERRIRRIFPALFLIMFLSVPFAWFLLMPLDMKDFSQSLIAVSSFASNILFLSETGYWGVVNELKPLLHTWSLAVEEQYYLLFPLFLMLLWRYRKQWIFGSFLLMTSFSLAASHWGAYNNPTANFFLLPTRGWEIAIGANIAFFCLYKDQTIETLLSKKFVNEVLSVFGLLLIGYSVFAFDETLPFPSFFALVPTIGTGLIIIFSSPKTLVGRLLGTKLLVTIGLISYSAYLWHQPLLAFARHRSLGEPSAQLIILLVVLSFPLAYLSWGFVERPFRENKNLSRNGIFVFAAVGSLLFVIVGITGHITNGFDGRPTRTQMTQKSIERRGDINYGLSETCDVSFTLSPNCRTSDEPEILVWGDSYAMHLVQGIIASNRNAKIIQMTKSVCGPFFDLAPVIEPEYPVNWAKDCLEFTREVRSWLIANNTVKYVVVSSTFSQYISNEGKLLFRSSDLIDANINIAAIEFEKTLEELELMGITPVIFSPPPKNGVNLGRCLTKAEWMGLDLEKCNFRVDEISQNTKDVYRFLERFEGDYRIVRLDRLICDDVLCETHLGSSFIYRDEGHLSNSGSASLGKQYEFYNMIIGD